MMNTEEKKPDLEMPPIPAALRRSPAAPAVAAAAAGTGPKLPPPSVGPKPPAVPPAVPAKAADGKAAAAPKAPAKAADAKAAPKAAAAPKAPAKAAGSGKATPPVTKVPPAAARGAGKVAVAAAAKAQEKEGAPAPAAGKTAGKAAAAPKEPAPTRFYRLVKSLEEPALQYDPGPVGPEVFDSFRVASRALRHWIRAEAKRYRAKAAAIKKMPESALARAIKAN